MSIIVQKSAGQLSSLISGNEFYETVYEDNVFCCNGSALFRLDTASATIPWTPTSAGNFLGVVIAAYCGTHTTTMSGDLKIELQEDSGGWTTRLTRQLPLSTWWPANLYTRFNGLIDVRFASTYAITTSPSTWRLVISLVGYSGPAFYLQFSQNGPTQSNLFFIPYIDNQVTWTSSDTVVVTDQIEIDQNWTLPAKDVQNGTQTSLGGWNRYMSIWGTAKNITDATNPQLYIPPTLSADISCESEGSVYFSSHSDGLLIGDSESSPIPAAYNVSWIFTGITTTKQPGFITYSSSTTYVGRSTFLKAFGTRPNIEVAERTNEISIGTDQLKVQGDVTSDWSIGDRLMLTGAQGGPTAPSYDYREVEMRTINGLSYSAGETTITLDSNVTSFYPLQTDVPNHVVYCERNVVLGGETAASATARSWWRLNGATIEFVGIENKYLYQLSIGYTVPSNYPASEHADLVDVYKGCVSNECYYNLRIDASGGGGTIEDSYTVSDSSPGSSINYYGFYFYQCRYSPVTVSNCIFAGKHAYYALVNAESRALLVSGCYLCSPTAIWLSSCISCEIDSNYIHKCRYAYSLGGTVINTYTHGNVIRDLHASTAFKQGDVFLMSSNQVIFGWYSEEDDVETFRHYFVDAANGFFQVVFDSCLASDYAGNLMESNSRDSWFTGSFVGFNRHNQVEGQVFKWEPEGYVETTGTGLTDTESHTSGAGKIAWRQQKLYDDTQHVITWHVPVDAANEPVTIAVWCKLASLSYAAGTYVAPTVRMAGLGITGTPAVAQANVTTTDWQLVVVTGTPTRVGRFTVTLEIETDASEANSRVYWDDAIVSYAEPPLFGGLDVAFDAAFVDPPLNLFATAAQVWAELLTANQISGSFGEWVQSLLPTATRDEILSDSTPFDGADVPAIKSAIAALNDLSSSDVQTVLTNQGYTSGRASNLDNLDTSVAGVETAVAIGNALLHDNVVVDQHNYDAEENLLSFRVRAYDSKANAEAAGATGLLYTFYGLATFNGVGGLQDFYRLTREGS